MVYTDEKKFAGKYTIKIRGELVNGKFSGIYKSYNYEVTLKYVSKLENFTFPLTDQTVNLKEVLTYTVDLIPDFQNHFRLFVLLGSASSFTTY